MITFKDKQGKFYIDVLKVNDVYSISVYDFKKKKITKQREGITQKEALKLLLEYREEFNCDYEL